ncbi:MAG: BrnT family toxin [Bauldia sp.]
MAEIESLFASAPVFATDIGHSPLEERVRAIGQAASGRFVFVVFTVRHKAGKSLIRPISARYMHRREIRRYEQTGP